MKAHFSVVIVVSALAAAGQPMGAISGTALDSTSGTPLAGVKVTLNFSEGTATTDTTGSFEFGKLKAADYYLKAEKEGFAKLDGQLPRALRLADGEKVTGFVLRLAPESILSGRVSNAKGEPVEAYVTLTNAEFPAHVASEQTKAGEFRLRGLAAGSYKLSAQPQAPRTGIYSLTYYPSETRRELADTINLKDAEQKSSVDIVLQDARYFTIRGRFTGDIPPGRQTTVGYQNLNGEPLGFSRSGVIDSEGRFTLEVPPGEYRLKVTSMAQSREQPLVLGFRELRVMDTGVNDVVIPHSPIRSIRAKFRWARSGGKDALEATFMLNPMAGLGILQYGKREADGWVTLSRVSPDRYSILPGDLPKGTYVQSILAGGADITKSGLDLISGVSTELEIVIADDGGLVGGTVVDAAQRPVPGSSISIRRVTPERPEQELWSKHSLGDANGRFWEAGIAPGEYSVTARANGKTSAAETIRVVAGGRLQLQFVLP